MIKGIVIIGASTGGPAALEHILPQLPAGFRFPVVVVQHLSHHFIQTFQKRVSTKCQMDLIEAYDGLSIVPNTIYIVPGGINTKIVLDNNNHPVVKTSYDTVEIEVPSINKLMISATNIYHQNTLGVILTGMGKDGFDGIKAIKDNDGHSIAQDQNSSVVFGMPKEIIDANLADEIVPLNDIVQQIINITNTFK